MHDDTQGLLLQGQDDLGTGSAVLFVSVGVITVCCCGLGLRTIDDLPEILHLQDGLELDLPVCIVAAIILKMGYII